MFTYINPSTNLPTKTELSQSEIAYLERNYFLRKEREPSTDEKAPEIDIKEPEVQENVKHKKFRINIHGGYSYKLGISSANTAEEEEYERDIRNGYRIGGGVDFYFNRKNGIGFKFSQFNSRADLDVEVIVDQNTDSTETFAAQERLRISQFSFLWRRRLGRSTKSSGLNLGLGMGIVAYRDDITFLSQTLSEQAIAISLDIELSYDLAVSEKFYLTFGADMGTGYFENSIISLPDGTTENITYPEGEGVSTGRASLWVGLTFKI